MSSNDKHYQAFGTDPLPVLIMDVQDGILGEYFYQHCPALSLEFLTPG
jgi:hypothetical protein